MNNVHTVFPTLQGTIDKLTGEFKRIPEDRKQILHQLTSYIKTSLQLRDKALLNFICTHNSRRSHISQAWAQTAAYYYGVTGIETFSGGTEATAFNPRAVYAMEQAGFKISASDHSANPRYRLQFSETAQPLILFSKKFDDDVNPKKDFAAVMTCSHADENCPVIIGASARIALTYNDPKDFDGTNLEKQKYLERVEEIGREILFAFSQVKNR